MPAIRTPQCLATVLAALGLSAVLAGASEPVWQNALDGPQRTAENRARDEYRHPEATLNFLGVTPQQTVVEIWPGRGGWYTQILAPLLRDEGQLYAAHWAADSRVPFFRDSRAQYDAMLAASPAVYDRVVVTVLEPPGALDIAPPASADRVLTFRNVHNWLKAGTAEQVFSAMYRALKPGGLLGVVEHRAPAGTPMQAMIDSGYVTEAAVIGLAEAAGFELVGQSEINANPRDDARHPKGVWTLPPSLRLGDVDRETYLAIGESDRMTLKFRKPGS